MDIRNEIKFLNLNRITYMPNNSNFSFTVGALKLRMNSPILGYVTL